MSKQYFNADGDEIELHFTGSVYIAKSKLPIEYVSQYKFGAITAYEEGIDMDGEIFFSRHDGLNYKSKLSEKLSKNSDGKKIFLISRSVDYLV